MGLRKGQFSIDPIAELQKRARGTEQQKFAEQASTVGFAGAGGLGGQAQRTLTFGNLGAPPAGRTGEAASLGVGRVGRAGGRDPRAAQLERELFSGPNAIRSGVTDLSDDQIAKIKELQSLEPEFFQGAELRTQDRLKFGESFGDTFLEQIEKARVGGQDVQFNIPLQLEREFAGRSIRPGTRDFFLELTGGTTRGLGEILATRQDIAGQTRGELSNILNQQFTREAEEGVKSEVTKGVGFNSLGRMQLQQRLKRQFGPGFRNVPAAREIMESFDLQIGQEQDISNLRKLQQQGTQAVDLLKKSGLPESLSIDTNGSGFSVESF